MLLHEQPRLFTITAEMAGTGSSSPRIEEQFEEPSLNEMEAWEQLEEINGFLLERTQFLGKKMAATDQLVRYLFQLTKGYLRSLSTVVEDILDDTRPVEYYNAASSSPPSTVERRLGHDTRPYTLQQFEFMYGDTYVNLWELAPPQHAARYVERRFAPSGKLLTLDEFLRLSEGNATEEEWMDGLQGQPKAPDGTLLTERRFAQDNIAYTWYQFVAFYGPEAGSDFFLAAGTHLELTINNEASSRVLFESLTEAKMHSKFRLRASTPIDIRKYLQESEHLLQEKLKVIKILQERIAILKSLLVRSLTVLS